MSKFNKFPERNIIGINSKKETFLVSIIQKKIQRRHTKKINKRIQKYCSTQRESQRNLNDSRITLTKVEENEKEVIDDSCSSTCDVQSHAIPFEVCYCDREDEDDNDSFISFLSENTQQANSLFSGFIADNQANDDVIMVSNEKVDQDQLWTGRIIVDKSSTVAEIIAEQNDKTPTNSNKKLHKNDNITTMNDASCSVESEPLEKENLTQIKDYIVNNSYTNIKSAILITTNTCIVAAIIFVMHRICCAEQQNIFFKVFPFYLNSTNTSFYASTCHHYYFVLPKIIVK